MVFSARDCDAMSTLGAGTVLSRAEATPDTVPLAGSKEPDKRVGAGASDDDAVAGNDALEGEVVVDFPAASGAADPPTEPAAELTAPVTPEVSGAVLTPSAPALAGSKRNTKAPANKTNPSSVIPRRIRARLCTALTAGLS